MTPSALPPALLALGRFVRSQSGLDFAQVRIDATAAAGTTGESTAVSEVAAAFELRHLADVARPASALRPVLVGELRPLAQATAPGEFRPIKTAPNLRSGWICAVADGAQLGLALEALYPGAVTDWWAATTQSPPPIQHYREFTGRQSGMYRITQQLNDAEVAAVIQAGCAAQFCLRKRLWTVEGHPPDGPDSGKSIIPCLEPCPLMLEFARRARRLLQADPAVLQPPLGIDECTTLVAALNVALAHPVASVREGDLNDPANPRRIRLLRDRLQGLLPQDPGAGTEE